MKFRFLFHPAFAILAFGKLSAAEIPIPMTEDYLPAGRVSTYLEAAQDFLRKNPENPHAPRLAQDLLMVAKATGKNKIADEVQPSLLFRYGNNLQANHLLASLGSDARFPRASTFHALTTSNANCPQSWSFWPSEPSLDRTRSRPRESSSWKPCRLSDARNRD